MKNILLILAAVFFAIRIDAQQNLGKNHALLNINCKSCHVCEVPTKDDPCLIECPREKYITVFQKPEQTPDVIIIDQLSNRYGPVYFAHKIHAQMSEMSGGCQGCHHFNTLGPILKCNSCHETVRRREDIRLPDLKGAYHRQCMDCHRQWSQSTGCNSCHTLKSKTNFAELENVQKKYEGKDHPTVQQPTKIIYQTNSDKGKLVTFYHDDHTDKFGYNCISCHKQESCTKCHDVNKASEEKIKPISISKTFAEQHERCISCHSKNEPCAKCHSDKELKPFDHERSSGWALKDYHAKLSCNSCHESKRPFSKMDNNCLSCHKDWNNTNFVKIVT